MYAGKKLRQLRLDLELNQSEMALELGLSQSYYSGVESGKRKITGKMIENIQKKWGVNEGYFINTKMEFSSKKMRGKNVGVDVGVANPINVTNNKSDSKQIILKRKLAEYLSKNPDVEHIDSAAINLLGFEYVLEETVKRHLNKLLLISDIKTTEMSFDEIKEVYWKHIEELTPYKNAFINLSNAINTFYKEMYEAGDNWFDFAVNH